MTLSSLAVGSLISRLSSPSPVVKLLVANHLASLLVSEPTKTEVLAALIQGLKEARFESEITELLTVPLLVNKVPIDLDGIRTAIAFPSVLSDSMLSLASGQPFLVKAWTSSHSGAASGSYRSESREVLQKAQIIPPFIGYRLAKLETESGLPFVRQWCFEFDSLARRAEEDGSSHFIYFSRGDHEYTVGQFVSTASHRARSAYLRTLALAVERWRMSVEIAEYCAEDVQPCNPRLLGLIPTSPPVWSNLRGAMEASDHDEWVETVSNATESCAEKVGRALLHADFLIASLKNRAAEVEFASVYSNRADLKAEEIFAAQDEMPGRWSYEAKDSFSYKTLAEALPGGRFVLAAVPLADGYLGLFNSDLMSRLPYGPRLFAEAGELSTSSELNRIAILSNSQTIGSITYWNRNWHPTHLKYLKPNCGVATTVSAEFLADAEKYTRLKKRTFWRLRIAHRKKDHGPWEIAYVFGGGKYFST